MIEIEISIPASAKTVWENLTDETHMRQWWDKGVSLELKQGGKFYEPWTDDKGNKHITLGTVTAIDDGKRLQMNWQDASWIKPTRVEFVVLGDSDGGTKLLIQHSGWGAFADEKKRQKKFDEHQAGWLALAERLRDYCLK